VRRNRGPIDILDTSELRRKDVVVDGQSKEMAKKIEQGVRLVLNDKRFS
jgi:hypothetical protein